MKRRTLDLVLLIVAICVIVGLFGVLPLVMLNDAQEETKKDSVLRSGYDYIIIETTQARSKSGIRKSQIENVEDIIDLVKKTKIDAERIILVSRELGIMNFDKRSRSDDFDLTSYIRYRLKISERNP